MTVQEDMRVRRTKQNIINLASRFGVFRLIFSILFPRIHHNPSLVVKLFQEGCWQVTGTLNRFDPVLP